MTQSVRKTLSIKKTHVADPADGVRVDHEYNADDLGEAESWEQKEVLLDRIDVLLPCRIFQVTYKVAEQGGVSLTSEFLLRLLYAVEDGMDDERIAQFFGFNHRELAFVVNEVLNWDYAIREEGRLRLTKVGRGLFSAGNGTPHILTVEKRTSGFGFDSISLCGQEVRRLDPFMLSLPVLEEKNQAVAANPSEHIRQEAFRRSFSGFDSARRHGVSVAQQHLYSVDSVTAEKRFLAAVPVRIIAEGGDSANIQVDLSDWHTGHELEDREAVVNAITALVDSIVVQKTAHDEWAYKQLLAMAPSFLQRYKRRDGFAVARYHRHALQVAAEPRADRPTVPLLGTIFTPANIERLAAALKYGTRILGKAISQHEAMISAIAQAQSGGLNQDHIKDVPAAPRWPHQVFWLTPNKHWGQSRALPIALDLIRQALQQADVDSLDDWETIAVRPQGDRATSRPPTWVRTAFSKIMNLPLQEMPSNSLEILYVPNLVAAALVHAPISPSTGALRGFPVPLGFLSFDPEVVAEAGRYFMSVAEPALVRGPA